MKNNAAWKIEGATLYKKAQELNNLKTDPEIITIVKNSENSAKTTAEYIKLTAPTDYAGVASFPATRMAKYASLAIINTNLQIEKETNLKLIFEKLYPYILDYSTSKEFKEKIEDVIQKSQSQAQRLTSKVINNDINVEEQEAKNLYETIQTNYHKLPKESDLKTPEQYLEKILYEKKINENKAPNLLVITIEPRQYIIDLAVKNDGKALIYLITIPAEKCVERAYERAEEEKRLVPTEYIINANIKLATNFHNVMADNIGKNIEYKILDNNVEKGKKLILIEQGNLQKNTIKIYDQTRLNEFLCKQNLNPKAQNPQELYSEDYHKPVPTYKFSDSSLEMNILDETQIIGE